MILPYCEICGKQKPANTYPIGIATTQSMIQVSLCAHHIDLLSRFWKMMPRSVRSHNMIRKWVTYETERLALMKLQRRDILNDS